mmetsp:Transcript_91680/g.247699  ORF Transcript_91680/g.247699 Transcript_91680/m.247699 type:complete len:181 (+) Transcript_91680:716-1258(+)
MKRGTLALKMMKAGRKSRRKVVRGGPVKAEAKHSSRRRRSPGLHSISHRTIFDGDGSCQHLLLHLRLEKALQQQLVWVSAASPHSFPPSLRKLVAVRMLRSREEGDRPRVMAATFHLLMTPRLHARWPMSGSAMPVVQLAKIMTQHLYRIPRRNRVATDLATDPRKASKCHFLALRQSRA